MGKKASLPEILEQDYEEKDAIVELMERALELKITIGKEDKDGTEGSGLLGEQQRVRERLGEFAADNGLEGMRHNKLVFTHRLQDGRRTVDGDKLAEALLAAGVPADVIQRSIKAATTQGDSFWVRQIDVLK